MKPGQILPHSRILPPGPQVWAPPEHPLPQVSPWGSGEMGQGCGVPHGAGLALVGSMWAGAGLPHGGVWAAPHMYWGLATVGCPTGTPLA